jgi:uncharacterized membrane protein
VSLVELDERGRALDRVLAFSDGVFAIAITLLVLNFRVPHLTGTQNRDTRLFHSLSHDSGLFIGFIVSFYSIARFWIAHHSLSLVLRRVNAQFVALNLVFLAFIVFLPFPTELVGVYGNTATAIVFYAGTLVVTSALSWVLWQYAHRRRLTDERAVHLTRRAETRSALTAAVFGLSIPLAFADTGLAKLSWGLLVAAQLVTRRQATPRRGRPRRRQPSG